MPEEHPRPRWLAPLGALIAVVFMAGLFGAATRSLDSGPDHPDEWDPRVADLAAFVEEERGHEFEHPVHVDFLTPAEYTAITTEDDEGPSEEVERADFDDYAGQLRALGVASGELDLYEAFNSVVDSGTLAFYDPTDERIRVRGTEMSVGLEVTIVHELTHALQDQHFDLDRLNDETIDSGASAAFRGLGEGDALRVENAYIEDELTDAEQAEYDEEYAEELADSETATSDVPPFMEAVFGVPYALGQPFVTMLFKQDGNESIDDAFRQPPDTEEHLLDPASFLAEESADGSADDLDLDIPEDAEVLEEGPFGAPTWYLFLAERIDPKVAFEATLGWDGDAFAAYEEDGEVCVKAVFLGDTDTEEDEMAAALDEWEAAMVGGQAEAIEVDGHPGIETCDPGEGTDLELTGRSERSLFLPNLWGYLVADAASALGPEGSRCFATAVLDELTYEEIVDPEARAFAAEGFDQTLDAAFDSCAS